MKPPFQKIRFSQAQVAEYYRWRVPTLEQNPGATEWRGPCPIHNGDHDNFAVDPWTGRWYCHSQCSRGGDIIALEMALTNDSGFIEARANIIRFIARFEAQRRLNRRLGIEEE